MPERSHIQLHKLVLSIILLTMCKKRMSAHQLMRNLGLGSYKSAWFLAYCVRETATDIEPNKNGGGPLGGAGKVVESDESVIGGRRRTAVIVNLRRRKRWLRLLSAADECGRSMSRTSTPSGCARS